MHLEESLGIWTHTLQKNQYTTDLERTAFFGGLRTTFPALVTLSEFLPILPFFREVVKAGERMLDYADDCLSRYKRLAKADPVNPKPTLFTKLIQDKKQSLSHIEIRAEAQSYIIAGSDTTANTLTYLVWAVCRDYDIKRKLVGELATLPEAFCDQDLLTLTYLSQVIEETLRLYGAAPSALPRVVPPGGATLAGYRFSEGTVVSTQAYSLHRDPVVFSDPLTYVKGDNEQCVLTLMNPS
jgi:cytochrome P450